MTVVALLVFSVLASATADEAPTCPAVRSGGTWEAMREVRRQLLHGDRPDFREIRRLTACEAEAARAVVRARPELGLAPVCIPREVDFHVCNEARPEFGCAQAALDRYLAEGCLTDPHERPRYHRMMAMFWRRRVDFVQAESHLDEAATHVQALLLRRLLVPDERPDMGWSRLLLELAIQSSERTELAALLRDGPAMSHHIAEVAALLPGLTEGRWASSVADIQNQVGWSLLLARESELALDDAAPWLHAAREGFDGGPGRDPRRAANVRINLALTELQRGDPTAALGWIEAVDERSLSAEELLWLDLIGVRAETRAGRPGAAQAWHDRMTSRPDVARVPMADWYVAQARGELLDATEPERALAAYVAAEEALETHALESRAESFGPLADGRYAFFAEATRRLVALQWSRDLELAASAARRARNRATRMVTRARCGSEGEPPRPSPGELRLLFTRVARRGQETAWMGFAIASEGVVGRELRLGEVPQDLHRASADVLLGWSERLLAPFADAIDAAERLVVLPTEELHAVPFHALPWDDGLLIDALPVTYGLDWEGCAAQRVDDRAASATLILDGQSPRLTAEGSAISQLLRDAGRTVTEVTVRQTTDLEPLFSGAFAVAHVAAHGDHVPGSGLLASDDRLLFADDLWLTRDQILRAPRVPALVFMSACQSSFIDTERLGGGISVAHAFLLGGARAVVGATHDLDDRMATAFARRFYAGLGDGGPAEAPYAWQAALVHVRGETAPSQHPSLRMLRLYVR